MADKKKTVEIILKTTLQEGSSGGVSKIIEDLGKVEKSVKDLNGTFTGAKKSYTQYRGYIWRTKNALDSLIKSQDRAKSGANIASTKSSNSSSIQAELEKNIAAVERHRAKTKDSAAKSTAEIIASERSKYALQL
jgi:predicted amino acid racemase